MPKFTLKKYLHSKRIELYERVNELKDKMLGNNFTERDVLNLEVAEAQLNLVREIIEICNTRTRY